MKSTIVPAQVTSVEDKIGSLLNLTQVFLIIGPLLVSFLIFLILPSPAHINLYKTILMVLLNASGGLLALRLKGILVLRWIGIFSAYFKRPRYFLFDKNDDYLRGAAVLRMRPTKLVPVSKKITYQESSSLIKLIDSLEKPSTKLAFKPLKKGGFDVVVNKTD